MIPNTRQTHTHEDEAQNSTGLLSLLVSMVNSTVVQTTALSNYVDKVILIFVCMRRRAAKHSA